MHLTELSPIEQRVLGSLLEKRWTTPDQYPLSLNALRLACNQSTNRDPVTRYEEAEVRDAAQRLSRYGLARLASGAGSRATKYRHLAEEALGLGRDQLAVLCVLLLRGPQTPGELKARSERMATLATLGDVERVLGELAERGCCARLQRRPGQKEDRFAHLLGPDDWTPASDPRPAQPKAAAEASSGWRPGRPAAASSGWRPVQPAAAGSQEPAEPVTSAGPGPPSDLQARVGALEADVAALRAQLAQLLD